MKYFLIITLGLSFVTAQIPLPEHPRPDFKRPQWINLNGKWDFRFDSDNIGISNKWFNLKTKFEKQINVPFPWGSKLSELKDEANIGWYKRNINVPENWKSKKTYLTIGASDWETNIWLDGQFIGSHQGGYVPFSFDLTPRYLSLKNFYLLFQEIAMLHFLCFRNHLVYLYLVFHLFWIKSYCILF